MLTLRQLPVRHALIEVGGNEADEQGMNPIIQVYLTSFPDHVPVSNRIPIVRLLRLEGRFRHGMQTRRP